MKMLPGHKIEQKERSSIVSYRKGRHEEGVTKELLASFMFVYKYLKKNSLIYTCKSIYCKIYVLYNTDYISYLRDAVESLHSVNDSYMKARERSYLNM